MSDSERAKAYYRTLPKEDLVRMLDEHRLKIERQRRHLKGIVFDGRIPKDNLRRAIMAGLRHTIADHGPITKNLLPSAFKRIYARLVESKGYWEEAHADAQKETPEAVGAASGAEGSPAPTKEG